MKLLFVVFLLLGYSVTNSLIDSQRSKVTLTPDSEVYTQWEVVNVPIITEDKEDKEEEVIQSNQSPCELWRVTHPSLASQLKPGEMCYN